MKTKTNLYFGKLVTLLFMLLVNVIAIAQPFSGPPFGGGTTGTTPPCWDPECVPIDGGLGFLIAAGAVLGVKKIRDYKKQ